MQFIADEGVDYSIVERLRRDGYSVIYMAEAQPGTDDDDILSISHQTNAILITLDKDFGELVYRLDYAMSGVILVRLAGLQAHTKANIVARAVVDRQSELVGAFTVISPGLVRVRRRSS